MARKVDRETLLGFIEEAQGYLPIILKRIDEFRQDSTGLEKLEEAHRYIHTIKGASSMVGLSGLSHIAHHVEEALEEIGNGQLDLNDQMAALLRKTVNQIGDYLEGAANGQLQEEPLLADVTQSFRQRQTHRSVPTGAGLPEDDIPSELLETFYLESEDHLRNINIRMAALNKEPAKKELQQDIRRNIHTLKGAAGVVGLHVISHLAHRMEDLLDLIYEDGIAITPDIMDLLFTSTDMLEDLIEGKLEDDKGLRRQLQNLYTRYTSLLGESEAGTIPADQTTTSRPFAPAQGGIDGQVLRVSIERLDELVKLVSEVTITHAGFEQRMADFAHEASEIQAGIARLQRITSDLEAQYEAVALKDSPLLLRELSETTGDLRTVGSELPVVMNDFENILARQRNLSNELQEKLMRVRMVPLATLTTRLHRTVRVVASEQRKLVDLTIEGEDIQLDKIVLEEMAAPLLHLLRNAVNHGIEPPALRKTLGKPERGAILLRAYYEGNQTVIQISDDGSGLEPQALRSAAVNKGYISKTDAPNLTNEELYSLVFMPGFSTAQDVSEVSGRGVGLDVVRTNVHKLQGSITLDSKSGQGLTFTIRLPMTLAIMRALLVKTNNETFAMPLASIIQILRVGCEDIEYIGQNPVIRVAGSVYPLRRLGEVLNRRPFAPPQGDMQPPSDIVAHVPVLILNAGRQKIALAVDHLLEEREIVVKSLGNHLRRIHGIAGATLMGDGSVALILNPADLVTEAVAPPSPPVDGGGEIINPPWTGGKITKPEAQAAARTLTVMIVDDSASVRHVIANLIRNAGWQAEAASDGVEALELLGRASQLPDLILLDAEMPQMDGYELLAHLQTNETYKDIPVVFLTSHSDEKRREKAMELGGHVVLRQAQDASLPLQAAGYISKPYQDEALLDMIRRLARKSQDAKTEGKPGLT